LSILASLWHMHFRITRPVDSRGRSPSSAGSNTSIPSDKTSLLHAKDSSTSTRISRLVAIPLAILVMSVMLLATRVVIPDLRDWEAGGTTFWLGATPKDMWPSRLEKEIEPDRSCVTTRNSPCFPSNIEFMCQLLSYWPHIDPLRKVMPEQAGISGRKAVRRLEARFRGPFNYQPPITTATIPSAQIADTLSELATYWFEANTHNCIKKKVNFCYYNNIQYSVEALQPVVFVRCNPNKAEDLLRFPRLDRGPGAFPLVDLDRSILNKSSNNALYPALEWIDLPEATFGLSSIGAVVPLHVNNRCTMGRLNTKGFLLERSNGSLRLSYQLVYLWAVSNYARWYASLEPNQAKH
jgi:hypothetical protein